VLLELQAELAEEVVRDSRFAPSLAQAVVRIAPQMRRPEKSKNRRF
jgi:hypothetical protein